jgi:uncharacterized heparinase superfamily protein
VNSQTGFRGASLQSRALLYLRTVYHLRPVQIWSRLWRRPFIWHGIDSGAPGRRPRNGTWKVPARRRPSMTGPMTFVFLNEERCLPDGFASPRLPSQLWRYNLHYFDDLNAWGAESRRAWHAEAISTWIQQNPPGDGDAWAPYPSSLRIVNWIKYAVGGAHLEQSAIESLAVQARATGRRLEYRLLGNHLFANAKALVFAGLFFEGAEAGRWLEKGMAILARQIPEQILADGGQFERSPMYHALAFEDMLDLVNIAAAFPDAVPRHWRDLAGSWRQRAALMRSWLRKMCHPDGEISFFNDAAIGIAPSPAELDRYGDEVGASPMDGAPPGGNALHLSRLASSGYLRIDAPNAAVLLDVAPVGPDYLPGHAHADTLSFEASIFGQRLIVNGGTSQYGLGPEREEERGTPAHSTVTVNCENSSETWSGFRVARRAHPFELMVKEEKGLVQVSCAHDGYRRLRGRPVHRRSWKLAADSLLVEDRVEGEFNSAVARFHLHPAVVVSINAAGNEGELHLADGRAIRWRALSGKARVESSTYAAEFGRRKATKCIALDVAGDTGSSLELAW